MKQDLIKADSFQTQRWSGGTTTQLFLYPPDAAYAQRDFLFRLSTATVETEKSDFTPLAGFSRKIMVLSGSIHLQHEGHHARTLQPFEVDAFEGAWKTKAEGKCTDFNLMTREPFTGTLSAVHIPQGKRTPYAIQGPTAYTLIYLYAGQIDIELPQNRIAVEQGDLLVIQEALPEMIYIDGHNKSTLIISDIFREKS